MTPLDETGVDRSGLPFQWAISTPATVQRRLVEEESRLFQERVDALPPERIAGLLQAVRWWSVGRDHKGMPTAERAANRQAMRVLTEASRVFGPLTLEYRGPRLVAPSGPTAPPWAALFRLLYAGCAGRVELRALPSTARAFVAPDDDVAIATFLRKHRTQDLYFGVAARADDAAARAKPGALESCVSLGALFVDLDYKTISPDEARARLDAFSMAPGALIESGGGLHCYWPLATPLDLRAVDGQTRAYQLLRRITRAIGADPAAAEPARILRIPGTVNHKYDPPRPVRFVTLAP